MVDQSKVVTEIYKRMRTVKGVTRKDIIPTPPHLGKHRKDRLFQETAN